MAAAILLTVDRECAGSFFLMIIGVKADFLNATFAVD